MKTIRLSIPYIPQAIPVLLAGVLFIALWNPVIEPWFQDIGIVSNEDEGKESEGIKIKTITKEEYENKVEKKESFVLYVGRSSCPDCKVFEEILSEIDTEALIYKLDTQGFKDAIDADEENAQELYDAFKEEIGYEWIPYMSVYLNGEVENAFPFEFLDGLREMEQGEQDAYWNDVKEGFTVWLDESMDAIAMESACGIDERCE